MTQALLRPPVADPSPAGPLSRRRLGQGLFAGVAAAAVTTMLPVEEAAAITRAHRRRCRHFHQCPQHPSHTCRHLHRCKHRNHKAPTTTTPSDPPADPPVQPPTEPTGEAPAEPRVEEPVETPAEPPVQEPVETPAEPPVEEPVEPPVEAPPAEPGFADAPLPTAASLHLASRFTYGMTPALHEQMRAAGSPEAWFEAQLDPAAIADAEADAIAVVVGLARPRRRRHLAARPGRGRGRLGGDGELRPLVPAPPHLLRAPGAGGDDRVLGEPPPRPVHDDGVFTYRADYGKVIRSHALGRFDQMLVAAITHPAMGISLDNARSTKKAPNENLGRELLELHTVGARQPHRGRREGLRADPHRLPGGHVDAPGRPTTTPRSHWTGPVKVLDFTHANADADGRAVTEAYLTYLAHHPRTAERIARKLAVRFVSDTPSDGARRPPGAGVPRQRHRDQAGAAGAGRLRRSSRPRPGSRCAPHRRRRRHPPGARRTRSPGRSSDESARQRDPVADRRRSGRRRSTGPGPTGSPRTTGPGRRRHGCWPPSTPTTRWRAVVAQAGHDLPRRRRRGCPHAGRPVRRAGRPPVPAAPRQAGAGPAARGVLPGHRSRGRRPRSPLATRSCSGSIPVLLTTLLDTPDHMHR